MREEAEATERRSDGATQGMHALVVLVGLPRSGKTTWAREQGVPIVSPDAIRLATHGQRFWEPAEAQVWATAMTMVAALFLAGHPIVIVDGCHTSFKRRAFWVQAVPPVNPFPQWQVYYRWIRTPKEVCIERARRLEDSYIVNVIERMDLGAEWPGRYEEPHCIEKISDIATKRRRRIRATPTATIDNRQSAIQE